MQALIRLMSPMQRSNAALPGNFTCCLQCILQTLLDWPLTSAPHGCIYIAILAAGPASHIKLRMQVSPCSMQHGFL